MEPESSDHPGGKARGGRCVRSFMACGPYRVDDAPDRLAAWRDGCSEMKAKTPVTCHDIHHGYTPLSRFESN